MNEVINPHRTQQHSRPWNGRYEDATLLSGQGKYAGDVVDAELTGLFVRSPHAHAKIVRIDAAAARQAPGVAAVLTFADMKAAGVGSVSVSIPFPGRDGKMPYSPFRPALAGDRVMHVGEPIALVVARSAAEAEDAAALIEVEY